MNLDSEIRHFEDLSSLEKARLLAHVMEEIPLPVLRSSQTGDLYIQIQIETPQKLTKRQRELLQEFEELSSKDNNPESTGFFARMKEFFES